MSGVLVILLGLWGGLAPFAGPYAGFGFAPDETFHYTTDRLYLNILPAVAAVLGALIMLVTTNLRRAILAACLSTLGGAWFAVGPTVAPLWTTKAPGPALGDKTQQVMEHLTFHPGLGVIIVFLSALALSRFTERPPKQTGPTHTPADAVPTPETTQPMWPAQGRYARPEEPPVPTDQRVAGTPRTTFPPPGNH